ncbi:hypothetical protein MBLNU459_g8409t2 [Dothideomycetes sp. NU459]
MNRPNPFASSSFFKPALQVLQSASRASSPTRKRSLSLDDSDTEAGRRAAGTDDSGSPPSLERHEHARAPASIPLVDVSRAPSPFARNRAGVQSEDEDEEQFSHAFQGNPLLTKGHRSWNKDNTKRILQRGGLGRFLFGTVVGWRVYLALLIFWDSACHFGLLLMNRLIFRTGTYKFPYPMTMTFLQLAITHVLLLALASLTRRLTRFLSNIGLGAIVAPSQAHAKGNRPTSLTYSSGGIAGGGLLEFQRATAMHLLPVALVFTAKVTLSNISCANAELSQYMFSRIAVAPLTIFLTPILLRQFYPVQTVSSAMFATLNLFIAFVPLADRVIWESVVAGAFSSLFVALYSVMLLRAYRRLVSDLVPQGDLLAMPSDSSTTLSTGTKEETRAYWRTLHYTSVLSMLCLLPFVLVSGELNQIRRNWNFLDLPWFWFLVIAGGFSSGAIFSTTLLLIKATNPVTATFVSVPRSAFQLVLLSKFRLPVHGWIGVSLCWASCVWYMFARIREGRGRDKFAA